MFIYGDKLFFGTHLSLNYNYILVCNSLILLKKHKSKLYSDLLGPLAAGYAMLDVI